MIKKLVFVIVCFFAVPPALAWERVDTINLAQVIAGEEFCGLAFSQKAISDWVLANVPEDQADFPSDLNLFLYGARSDQDTMSTSQKTAHCTQIGRLAKSYGFVE